MTSVLNGVTSPEIAYSRHPAEGNKSLDGLPVLLLHGWGCNRNTWGPLAIDLAASGCEVYAIDFPGHGQTPPPEEAWGTEEYGYALEAWMEQHTGRCHVIAHSFGVRVALRLFTRRPDLAGRLVFTGGAGLPPKRSAGYYIKVYTYKAAKRLTTLPGLKGLSTRMQRNAGSADYKALEGVMRAVFVKAVNEDLAPLLPQLQVPTLLVWGDHDAETPLWMGKRMEQDILDAGLVVFENAGHYAHLEQYARFLAIIQRFLLKEDTVIQEES